uniref:PROP1-like PPR domain-containing protein n=1 Tax=Kalanchoe fedtschenkoi TaxID=63787 RepID=A0A7N1A0H3_KALFE
MILKHFASGNAVRSLIRRSGRVAASSSSNLYIGAPLCQSNEAGAVVKGCNFRRWVHLAQPELAGSEFNPIDAQTSASRDPEDAAMGEFLSRFVYLMRGELTQAYPNCDKESLEGMLVVIVSKVAAKMERGGGGIGGLSEVSPSDDLSEDLWRTVWEVSGRVMEDMKKEKKKERMKVFLQSREVKELCRFAGEVGIRGEMLREMRFKWGKEKMEEAEFYKTMKRMRQEAKQGRDVSDVAGNTAGYNEEDVGVEQEEKVFGLPKRRGSIRYKIYGLDLSDPKWAKVADKIHESGKVFWPDEPKEITGKCKSVVKKILNFRSEDDLLPLLSEYKELVQPNRVDWIALLDQLKEGNHASYLKVLESILDEESFLTEIRDYSKLIDIYASERRIAEAERILNKMKEDGFVPDVIILNILVDMYSQVGDFDHAKEAFEKLRTQGYPLNLKIYSSMIMAHVNSGNPRMAESLVREMEAKDIKPTKEIYMALLRSFSQLGITEGAHRIATTMQFAGFEPSLESCTLLIEAWAKAGDADQARSNFDYLMKSGIKPDDRCIAGVIAAYEKRNSLDKALSLLLQQEKGGFEPGIATYSVLVDWFAQCQLVEEAEQVLGKISELGEAPPLKVQVSICDMYSRVGVEKKALQALGVVEAKKDLLTHEDFERVILGLVAGGFGQEAQRMQDIMKEKGFEPSQNLKVSIMASRSIRQKPKKLR